MKEFNNLSEDDQFTFLKRHTNKEIRLLSSPVFVCKIKEEERAFIVESYKFDTKEEMIDYINQRSENLLFFYSCNHYKKLEISVGEKIILTPAIGILSGKVRMIFVEDK